MHRKFKELLHEHKVEVFQTEHNQKHVGEITDECMDICNDVLAQKYNYHFHKLPDANRAEIINMINNYTREAILPPVVEKLVHRQLMLEHRVDSLLALLEKMLDLLSQEPISSGSGA